MTAKINQRARHRARRALLQAIYQWQISGHSAAEIERQFATGEALRRADKAFFSTCLDAVLTGAAKLDTLYEAYLDRRVDQLDHIERAVLRAGVLELRDRIEVPFKVVLDEWVTLASQFGAEDGHRYINGVLDRVAKDLRPVEVAADTTQGSTP